MKHQQFLAVLCLWAIAFAPLCAFAAEKLVFKAPSSLLENALIPSGFEGTKAQLAAIDLNEDGLPEYIFRRPDAQKYDFQVYAQKTGETQLTLLGALQGTKILVANTSKHGIRNLMVFNDVYNDFTYQMYAWSPENKRYGLIKTSQLGGSQ